MPYRDWPTKIYVWKEKDEDDEDLEVYLMAMDKSELPDRDGLEIAVYNLGELYQLSVKKDLVKQ